MAVPTSPAEHGTLIYYGTEDFSGLYVQSASFSSKYANNDEAQDEDGITRSFRQSDGRVDVSFEGFLLNGESAPQVGTMATYASHTTGSLSNIIITDVTERTANKGWTTVSITGIAFEGIAS